MSLIIYSVLFLLVYTLQALPLSWTARFGRFCGAVAWILRLKHRRVVIDNLTAAFPAYSRAEIHQIARENMLRIGENYAAAIKTSSMPLAELRKICDVSGIEKLPSFDRPAAPKNVVVAVGHFGNFELYAMLGNLVPGARPASTYRGLKDPRLSQLMQKLRSRSGCKFFERRSEAAALKTAMNRGRVLLGLLADQHVAGGVWGPFLGRYCSSSPAPALFALRYEAPLYSAICYRTAPGRWRIEIGDEIVTHQNGSAREIAAITADINKAFEAGIRRDPANWFWVHNRWKPNRRAVKEPLGAPATALAVEPAPL